MYAIAGGTGNTGKVVAESLLAAGEKVRVIVREASKGAVFAARGAEVAVADLGDEAAMTRALTGVRGAYLLIPPTMAAPDFYAYQVATGRALAAAAKAAKVPHVVFLSSIGAELPNGTGPIAGLHPTEAAFSAVASELGTAVTFVRAAYFVENIASSLGGLAHGVLPTFFPADLKIDMIATRDIGRVAARALIEGGVGRSVIELGGPGVSVEDIANTIGEITGQRPNVVSSPVDGMSAALQGYGVPGSIADLYEEMTRAIIAGAIAYRGEGRRLYRETPLAEVVAGLLGR